MEVKAGQYKGMQVVKLDDGTLIGRDDNGFYLMLPTNVHLTGEDGCQIQKQIDEGRKHISIAFDEKEIEQIIMGFKKLDEGYNRINPYHEVENETI